VRAAEAYARIQRLQQIKSFQIETEGNVSRSNAAIEKLIYGYRTLLETSAAKPRDADYLAIDFRSPLPEFHPGELGAPKTPQPTAAEYIRPPSFFEKLIPSLRDRYAEYEREGQQNFDDATKMWNATETKRLKLLNAARRIFDEQLNSRRTENTHLIDGYHNADPWFVEEYVKRVFSKESLPGGIPVLVRCTYVPESRQLIIEQELPTVDVVPTVKSHKYIASRNEVKEVQRPKTEIKQIYASLIAQIALSTLCILRRTDQARVIDAIAYNGMVDMINTATGQEEHRCLISINTTSDVLNGIDFSRVDAIDCLRGLRAHVSESPHEMTAVRPIVAFNFDDPRFVEKHDILSELDTRSNLADLSPSEFEQLITGLFEKMGLETRQTRPSRDGGVDCVAWDMRPVIGGKVVIQAKRYRRTVGVSAVRDLFGTVMNEGATKGILVTTSGYGKSAFEFANNKPLELLNGSNLLALLKEHCNVDAKIDFPENWEDPIENGDANA